MKRDTCFAPQQFIGSGSSNRHTLDTRRHIQAYTLCHALPITHLHTRSGERKLQHNDKVWQHNGLSSAQTEARTSLALKGQQASPGFHSVPPVIIVQHYNDYSDGLYFANAGAIRKYHWSMKLPTWVDRWEKVTYFGRWTSLTSSFPWNDAAADGAGGSSAELWSGANFKDMFSCSHKRQNNSWCESKRVTFRSGYAAVWLKEMSMLQNNEFTISPWDEIIMSVVFGLQWNAEAIHSNTSLCKLFLHLYPTEEKLVTLNSNIKIPQISFIFTF